MHGKYWIHPSFVSTATCLIDCSLDEHARYAKAAMLCLSDAAMHAQLSPANNFSAISDEEARLALERGADKEAVAFLRGPPGLGKTIDPRRFVIERWGWIRIRNHRYYAWKWDVQTVNLLFFCEDYWQTQRVDVDCWLEFIELSTGKEFGVRHDEAAARFLVKIYGVPLECSPAIGG